MITEINTPASSLEPPGLGMKKGAPENDEQWSST
jgi:hypothetical protein